MTKHFNFCKISEGPLTLAKFERLAIVDRICIEDSVEGIVHAPAFKEDFSNSYYLLVRDGHLVRIRFLNATFKRLPYGQVSDLEFLGLYHMTKTQHQAGYWRWKEKIDGKPLKTYHL